MEPEKTYHIYTHANGSENLFREAENYRYFFKRYVHFINPIADTYAYCLMPNHFHLLVRIKNEAELVDLYRNKYSNRPVPDIKTLQGYKTLEEFTIRQFGHLFNAYTQAYNKLYTRMGSLFIHGFKRKEINHDSYLTQVIYYIHANPVHHGFTQSIENWPWSSYSTMLSDKPTHIDRNYILNWFGGRQAFYQFHQQSIQLKNTMELEI